ncbi:phosphotransferase [Streptomyces sp. SID13031]|uniref:phosphotransferase n=1 Tax=Streptomyces sp. SID13031 TaxID=2706046 RepID=UPI0013CAAA36|nr:phosphotransferase [Streptomyces sp. SID13031]NEA31357.1 phosphotransferase [Streptomyces sp. SID13031]
MKRSTKDSELTQRLARRLPGWGMTGWTLEEVEYAANSPTTAGLYRLRLGDDSRFVKVLRSYKRWPPLDLLPGEFRAMALAGDLWRYEADVYLDGLTYSLPTELRLPALYRVDLLDDDHLVMVLEDVRTTELPWDRERYGRAAELLGRLNVRLTRNDALPPAADRSPGRLTRLMVTGFVEQFALPPLLAPQTWKHPLLAGSRLRDDLIELAGRIPQSLHELAQRPQLMSHGDACPQNLLVPADAPDTFVGIDWSLSGFVAAGDDLGQLLIGRAHSGDLSVDELAELRELVIPRYHAGLVAEGRGNISEDEVRAGLDGALVLRNAFMSLPLDRLAEPVTDELARLVDQRLELTRYLVELGAVSLKR